MPAPIPPADPDGATPTRIRGVGRDAGPAARSTRRAWLLAGVVSLAAHGAVLLPALLARGGPTADRSVAELPRPPVQVTLFRPPPPRTEPRPGPAADPSPPAAAPTLTSAAPPAKARPTPPAPAPRPSREPVPPPPDVETVAARTPAPPAPMATLSDAQLAGAAVAGPGGGVGGRGGGGGAGGPGEGGCDMVRRLQDALRDDPEVRAAVTRAQAEVGPGRALLVWNGAWIRNPGEAGDGLAGVRQAISMEVAFAPEACRALPMRGLVLIRFSDGPGGARLVLGRGAWRWGDMLRGR